jgi:hypothetical protein
MPIQKKYFTPDSIRDKELDNLRSKLKKANV